MSCGTGEDVVPEGGYCSGGAVFLLGVAFLAGALAFFAVVALPLDSVAGVFFALVFFAGVVFLAAELFLAVDAFLAGAVVLAGDEVSAGATSLVGPGVDFFAARGACLRAVSLSAGAGLVVGVVGAEVGCGDVAVLGARSGGDARMARSSACAAPATRTSNPNRRNNRRLTTARLTPPDPQRTDHVTAAEPPGSIPRGWAFASELALLPRSQVRAPHRGRPQLAGLAQQQDDQVREQGQRDQPDVDEAAVPHRVERTRLARDGVRDGTEVGHGP